MRKLEVRCPFGVALQSSSIALVRRQALKRYESVGDVVGAFVRHPIADKLAPALRNNLQPFASVFFEFAALEGVELVMKAVIIIDASLSSVANLVAGLRQ